MDDMLLQQAVMDELEFDPVIDTAHIGVIAEKGVVTLSGHVSTYAEKVAAERAALRVRGVRAIAQNIEVRYPEDKKTSDDEIAQRALKVLSWHAFIPDDAVKVKVQNGFVALSGTVNWQYQRSAAESAVRKLGGVVGVLNEIVLHPGSIVQRSEVEGRIKAAFKRNAELEGNAIHVSVPDGHTVRLEGRIHAWNERGLAEQAAWSIPGVTKVEDRLTLA